MPGVNFKAAVGIALASSLAIEGIYYAMTWYRNRKEKQKSVEKKLNKKSESETVFHEVLFFPDKKIACKKYNSPSGCKKTYCPYTHEKTSLSKLHRCLTAAEHNVDVCVFTITCPELGDAIVELHKRGITVKVIVDNEQADASGSQIGKFRSEGIQVRPGRTAYFMHHKFVLIDRKALINGSFNWTQQAIMGNNENLLITNDDEIVQPYIEEFSRLWTQNDLSIINLLTDE